MEKREGIRVSADVKISKEPIKDDSESILSQHPNVLKHYKSHLMECESIKFVMKHMPYL